MADYAILRNMQTGEFLVTTEFNPMGGGYTPLQSSGDIDTSASDAAIDELNDQYEAGTITREDYSEDLDEIFEARWDVFENSTFADAGKHFYGERLHVNLGNGGNTLTVSQGTLDALGAIDTEDLQSPPHVLSVDGTERLVITADAVQGFDPNAFRSDNEEVGIDDGQVILTDLETFESRKADTWMNGEVFQFGDENNTRFILNDVMGKDVGVETLVIGDIEIDLGDRLRRYNELSDVRVEVSEKDALANGSYTDYGDGRFGIRDMDAVNEQISILVGIQEEVRQAIIDTQNPTPSVDLDMGAAPILNIGPN